MIKTGRKVIHFFLCAAMIFTAMAGLLNMKIEQVSAATGDYAKIHFISLMASTDCILLESNGQYALIDSGEDWDCITPETSTAQYPYVNGITLNLGYEPQVIHYLEKLGVKRLSFYLGTHAHSDHIGSCNEILEHFGADTVYLKTYQQEGTAVWDNQKVYDDALAAANQYANRVVMVDTMKDGDQIRLGAMTITLFNTAINDTTGRNENSNSICTLIEAFGRYAYLSGDLYYSSDNSNLMQDTANNVLYFKEHGIMPEDPSTGGGDGGEIVDPGPDSEGINNLAPNAASEEQLQGSAEGETDSYVAVDSYTAVLPGNDTVESLMKQYEEDQQEAQQYDNTRWESQLPNLYGLENISDEDVDNISDVPVNGSNDVYNIDLYKFAHHGLAENNPVSVLETLNPATCVFTGDLHSPGDYGWDSCKSTLFSTKTDSAAVVATFASDGIHTEYAKLTEEWYRMDGKLYHFDGNGRTRSIGYDTNTGRRLEKGLIGINTGIYYLHKSGYIAAAGWTVIDGKTYYFSDNLSNGTYGEMAKNTWLYNSSYGRQVYMTSSGAMDARSQKGQWRSDSTGYRYLYDNGTYARNGWVVVEGSWYFFNSSGYTAHGWLKTNGKWYLLNQNQYGALAIGWQKVNNKWFYLGSHPNDGSLRIGWQKIDGKWYYLGSDPNSGAMKTGWQKVNNRWYYLGSHPNDGSLRIGWQKVNNKWYYLGSDPNSGALKIGWQKIDNKWYYLGSDPNSGAMKIGWQKVNNKWYYLGSDPNSGAMKIGWQKVNNKWYYLGSDPDDGVVRIGWQTINNERYYLGSDPNSGAMKTDWQLVDGSWYYLDPVSGIMQTGWLLIGNNQYYLNSDSGAMQTGWFTLDDNRYYLDPVSGIMQTGWFTLDDNRYYLDPVSGIMQTGWFTLDDNRYYLDPVSGAMQTGWFTLDDNRYYLDPVSGAMQTGTVTIDDIIYIFDEDGLLVTPPSGEDSEL